MKQIRFDKDLTLEIMKIGEARARLWAWQASIEQLIAKYGKDATMFVDSGGNDSQFVVQIEEKEEGE